MYYRQTVKGYGLPPIVFPLPISVGLSNTDQSLNYTTVCLTHYIQIANPQATLLIERLDALKVQTVDEEISRI